MPTENADLNKKLETNEIKELKFKISKLEKDFSALRQEHRLINRRIGMLGIDNSVKDKNESHKNSNDS